MNRTRTPVSASGQTFSGRTLSASGQTFSGRTRSASGRTLLTLRRRYASGLRLLSLLLVLCCFWSFAGAGIAVAAAPQGKTTAGLADKRAYYAFPGKRAYYAFPHALAFHVPPPAFHAAPAALRSAPSWKLTQVAPVAHSRSAVPLESLLDEVGRLAHTVPEARPRAWKWELATHPSAHRAALLHIWLGEWQMAANEQPVTAQQHFRQAQHLLSYSDRLYGLATYDSAIALMFRGAYQEAADAFHTLIVPKSGVHGYDCSYAALWERHACACAGYHAQRASRGIPEPPRLDPQCGVAGLAASLQALALPYDKKTVLAACRVTGRGSNLEDLREAAPRLHVHARVITADDEGLMSLPKPLIAYVEHDHFISVVKADNKGVSYLCSDCGMWPGGRVNLTWAQWHMLEATLYLTVTKPGSVADQMVASTLAPVSSHKVPRTEQSSALRVSFTGNLSHLHDALRLHMPVLPRLRGHIFGYVGVIYAPCGYTLTGQQCKHQRPPIDGPSKGPQPGGPQPGKGPAKGPIHAYLANGPAAGDPVNLATGQEEYAPSSDLVVYNPRGPTINWGRTWQSLRPADSAYESDDFGPGWSHPYNIQVYDPTVTQISNSQMLVGTSASFPATGSEAAGTGLAWDIVLNGATVATSTSASGWAVSFASSNPYGGSSGTFTVTAPAGTTLAAGYKVRYLNAGYYMTGYASALFDVVSGYSIPQGGAEQLPTSGMDAPATGLTWDILQNGITVATSALPAGWAVNVAGPTGSPSLTIQAPLTATISGGYEVRFNDHYYYGIHSVFFSVAASQFAAATGTSNYKYVIEPNGARVQFTAPSVPTASQPKVICAVEPGMPLLVEWDYDAASPVGHYTITLADRTRWVTSVPSQEVVSTGNGYPYSYSLLYSLAQIVDRNGNALNFTYGYTSPVDAWPLLTGITDANTGATLLSLNRDTNGALTSVSDAYGRSVVYHTSNFSGLSGVDQVSQIIPTADLAQTSLPNRYTYGYTYSTPDGVPSLRLNTITVPSPTGSGTSMATINYDGQGYVASLVDGNGNTRAYTIPTDPAISGSFAYYKTHVTVTNSSSTVLYSYTALYGSNMNQTGELDANGRITAQYVYADANDPNAPSAIYDGNSFGQVPQNGSATIPITGSDGPTNQGSGTWDIIDSSGNFVANSATPGWSVSYSNGSLIISAPAGAAVGSGYKARLQYVYLWSVCFNIIAAGTSPKPPTTLTWDSYGNLLTETSPRGTTTTNTYSYTNFWLGELTQVQEGSNLSPPKAPITYAYLEPSGLIQSVTAPLPGTTNSTSTAVTSYTYDTTSQGSHGLGNLLTVTRPGNNAASTITTTLNYTTDGTYSQSPAMGQPLTVTDNLGKITHLRYDAQGNAAIVKDALGNETDQTYDIRNAPLQTVLPATGQNGSGHGGSQTSYLYTEPSGFATTQWPAVTLQYGPAVTQTIYDEGNRGAIRQVSSTYGAEGELLTVTGSTEPVSYTYDALYRAKTLTDAASHVTSYFYNMAGYLYQVVYPNAQTMPPTAPLTVGHADTVTFPAYDSDGNHLSRVDGNNVTTSYSYSAPDSQLTDITYPTGTIGNVHFAYDDYGRGTTMTDGTGSQSYAYDDDDDLTSHTTTYTGLAAQTLSYAYYPNGSRQTMTTSQGSFTYGYDAVGRLTSLLNPFSETSSWAYQDNGWLQTKTVGNGMVTTYTRDALGRLTDLVNKTSGGTTLSDFAVPSSGGYDGVSNRLSVTATIPSQTALSGTTSYAYDYGSSTASAQRSQLTGETSTRNGGYTNAFGYDGGTSGGPGNPTSFQGTTNTFNTDNQVTNTGYAYDGNGNPTTYQGHTLSFDPENRMTAYGSSQTDTYDGNGLRAQVGSGAPYFVYDGTNPVVELSSSGTVTGVNGFGADGLVSRRAVSAGMTIFYTFDERGNVSERFSGTTLLGHDLYDGYGTKLSGSAGDVWSYGGQWGYFSDLATGLILCTHRFYDPSTGRFLTRDPIGYGGGINLYGYVRNNPIFWIDPSGYLGQGTTLQQKQPVYPSDPTACCGADPYDTVPIMLAGGLGGTIGASFGGSLGAGLGVAAGGTAGTVAEPGGGTIFGAGAGAVLGGMMGGAVGGALGSDLGTDLGISLFGPKPTNAQEEFCMGAWKNKHENDAAMAGLTGGVWYPLSTLFPVVMRWRG